MAKKNEPTIKQLREAAKDMNAVMGLDPVIDTDAPKADLLEDIKENAAEADPKDKFTEDTWGILGLFGVKRAAKKAAAKPKKKAAAKKDKAPRVTKKSIVLKMTGTKKGATVEELATACTEAGLGDQELNLRVVVLWLRKLGWKNCKKKDLAENPRFKQSDLD
jgi:hypothetical protein